MNLSKGSVLVFVAAGLVAFAGSFVFLSGRWDNRAAESAEPDAAPAGEGRKPAANEEVPEQPGPGDGAPADEKANPAPAAPHRQLFLKRLRLPGVNDADPRTRAHDMFHRALYLDAAGARLLAVSREEVHCIEVASGKVLQTFRSESSGKRNEGIAASPDARFVVLADADGNGLTLRDAATGRAVGTLRVPENQRLAQLQWNSRSPSFTPAGDFLLVGVASPSESALHALSTKTGAAWVVNVPRGNTGKRDFGHLLAVPQWSTLLVANSLRADRKTNPSGLFAVNLATGKETPLAGPRVRPAVIDQRPLVLSPDGSLLLIKGADKLEVCDWRSGRVLFHHERNHDHYVQPWFTPDGKRFAVIRRVTDLIRYEFDPSTPGKSIGHRIDDEVFLFDVARQEQIGSFRPAEHGLDSVVSALALAADGQSFAVWTGSQVDVVDFQTAFGVAPLPSGPRLQGPEELPLTKPGVQTPRDMEQQKKRKEKAK